MYLVNNENQSSITDGDGDVAQQRLSILLMLHLIPSSSFRDFICLFYQSVSLMYGITKSVLKELLSNRSSTIIQNKLFSRI